MREHIRREAARSLEATWWLVPVAFAIAALAAVAWTQAEGEDSVPAAVAQPAEPAAVPEPMDVPPPAESALRVTEHVQAF